MILTNEQRKFLEYVKREHDCLGYYGTVNTILETGRYNTCWTDERIEVVLKAFREFRDTGIHKNSGRRGIVKKYLKG